MSCLLGCVVDREDARSGGASRDRDGIAKRLHLLGVRLVVFGASKVARDFVLRGCIVCRVHELIRRQAGRARCRRRPRKRNQPGGRPHPSSCLSLDV